MKKPLLLLLLMCLLFITSCELFTEEPKQGDVYYINVGIDYANNVDSSDDLKGTVNDAKELHEALKAVIAKTSKTGIGYKMVQEGAGIIGDDTYSIHGNPISSYPSKANIRHLLAKHANQANEEDLTIFTYSGHGREETGLLVLAYDGSTSETLAPDDLLTWMAAIPGKKLVILDSCYSGMFVEKSPSSTNTVLNNSIAKFFETYHSSGKYGRPDLFVLSASAHTDSYEMDFSTSATPHYHGAFTYALLKALGWEHANTSDSSQIRVSDPPTAKNGIITVDGLFKYVIKNQKMPSRFTITKFFGKHQHPLTTGGPLDLVLFNL